MAKIHASIKRYKYGYWADIMADGVYFASMRIESINRTTYGFISLHAGYTHIMADTAELITE